MIHVQCTLSNIDGGPGDIIIAALPDHPWGTLDRKHLLVIEWEDPELEQRLYDRRKAGERFPVITLPYAIRDGNTIIKRSTEAIDLDSRTDRSSIFDRTIEKPILMEADYTRKRQTAEDVGVLSRIWGGIKAAWDWMVA